MIEKIENFCDYLIIAVFGAIEIHIALRIIGF